MFFVSKKKILFFVLVILVAALASNFLFLGIESNKSASFDKILPKETDLVERNTLNSPDKNRQLVKELFRTNEEARAKKEEFKKDSGVEMRTEEWRIVGIIETQDGRKAFMRNAEGHTVGVKEGDYFGSSYKVTKIDHKTAEYNSKGEKTVSVSLYQNQEKAK